MVIAAGVAAAGTVAGSVASSAIGSSASGAASKAQQTTTAEALASQNAQFAYSQQQEQPYVATGDVALGGESNIISQYQPVFNGLQNNLVGLGDSATAQNFLEQTPGYQFTLSQGLKSTQNAAAARGLGVSGAALKAAANYSTGLADNTYEQQYQNASNDLTQTEGVYNALLGGYQTQANRGANTSVSAGTQGQAASTNNSNLLTSLGNSQGAAAIAGGNALTSGINGATNAATSFVNNPAFQNYLSGSGSQYDASLAGTVNGNNNEAIV